MAEQSRLERYKHLPPPIDPETLRTTQDVDPPPPDAKQRGSEATDRKQDDTYRELLWVVNRYG